MTSRTAGLLAGIVSSAVGAWFWTRRYRNRPAQDLTPARERGVVIFDNTPTAVGEESS